MLELLSRSMPEEILGAIEETGGIRIPGRRWPPEEIDGGGNLASPPPSSLAFMLLPMRALDGICSTSYGSGAVPRPGWRERQVSAEMQPIRGLIEHYFLLGRYSFQAVEVHGD
jgi:hypothetical protein